MDTAGRKSWALRCAVVLALVVAAAFTWRGLDRSGLPAGFVSGNGRIEATEIDIASKQAGRI